MCSQTDSPQHAKRHFNRVSSSLVRGATYISFVSYCIVLISVFYRVVYLRISQIQITFFTFFTFFLFKMF